MLQKNCACFGWAVVVLSIISSANAATSRYYRFETNNGAAVSDR